MSNKIDLSIKKDYSTKNTFGPAANKTTESLAAFTTGKFTS